MLGYPRIIIKSELVVPNDLLPKQFEKFKTKLAFGQNTKFQSYNVQTVF